MIVARDFTKVLLSLSSFESWGSPQGVSQFLRSALETIDGVELSVSYDDIQSWGSGLKLGIRVLPPPYFGVARDVANRIFELQDNVIRLSPLKYLGIGKEHDLALVINQLAESIKFTTVSIDLSDVTTERAQLFMGPLNANIKVVSIGASGYGHSIAIFTKDLVSSYDLSRSRLGLLYLNGPGQIFDSNDHFAFVELLEGLNSSGQAAAVVYSLAIQNGEYLDGLGELARLAKMAGHEGRQSQRLTA